MGLDEYADMMSPEELEEMKQAVMEDIVMLHARLVEFMPRAKADPVDRAVVEEVYRAFHSLSGTSGMIGLDSIKSLSAPAEDRAKARKLAGEAFAPDELESFDAAVRGIGEIIEREKG